MSTQSQVYSGAGSYTFNVPATVSGLWATVQAPGGGGGASIAGQDSKGAGGAGEFGQRVPIPVTAGGTLAIVIGAQGAGGVAPGGGGSAGGSITIGPFTFLGGLPATAGAGSTPGGKGAGPKGGNTALGNPGFGTIESPTAFGGFGGGAGGQQSVGPLIGEIGQYPSMPGVNTGFPHGHGGGYGGPTPIGNSGQGGGAGIAPATPAGFGGGGGGGEQTNTPEDNGATGAPGSVWLFWVEKV